MACKGLWKKAVRLYCLRSPLPKDEILHSSNSFFLFFLLVVKLISLAVCVQWGYVVITSPDGVLDHEEAIKRSVGGQVLGYFH